MSREYVEENIELITVVNSERVIGGKLLKEHHSFVIFRKKKLSDLVSWRSCKKIEGEKFL